MAHTTSLKFVIPDTVREVEILRVGSACYPYGMDGEPETVDQALDWALRSEWGRDMLTWLGVTWTPAS